MQFLSAFPLCDSPKAPTHPYRRGVWEILDVTPTTTQRRYFQRSPPPISTTVRQRRLHRHRRVPHRNFLLYAMHPVPTIVGACVEFWLDSGKMISTVYCGNNSYGSYRPPTMYWMARKSRIVILATGSVWGQRLLCATGGLACQGFLVHVNV